MTITTSAPIVVFSGSACFIITYVSSFLPSHHRNIQIWFSLLLLLLLRLFLSSLILLLLFLSKSPTSTRYVFYVFYSSPSLSIQKTTSSAPPSSPSASSQLSTAFSFKSLFSRISFSGLFLSYFFPPSCYLPCFSYHASLSHFADFFGKCMKMWARD